MRILLIDNYDSYTWNLVHLVGRVCGVKPEVVRNDETTAEKLLREDFTHIIVSPGPGTPAHPDDFGVCAALLRNADIPCLGVCLGHQGLAWSFGGSVVRAPQIMHGRISSIAHDNSGLFAGIPQNFKAVRYHSLIVAEPIPSELKVTAWTDTSVIMGLAHRTRPLYGVQFHPESIETEYGDRIIGNFLQTSPNSQNNLGSSPHEGNQNRTQIKSQDHVSVKRALTVRVEPLGVGLDPSDLFARMTDGEPYAFWLDSARNAYDMGKYSFLGSSSTLIQYFGRKNITKEISPSFTHIFEGTIFDYLKGRLDSVNASSNFSFPFLGGYVGYLGYGVKAVNGIGCFSKSGRPDAEFVKVDRYAVHDHETGESFLVTVDLTEAESRKWCSHVRALAKSHVKPTSGPTSSSITHALEYSTYQDHFRQVQDWLERGDSYECCYTYQLQAQSNGDPLSTYLQLRAINPAPYGAFLRFGVRTILSSSPERFVKVESNGWTETKPIKGTCAKKEDIIADEAAKNSLRHDEKTRSESLMIVDLLRNDLSKVCDVGSVTVPKLMEVESYATLHQLVTTIRGKLSDGISALDCVLALFPGGSMTGAPKKRSVELLDALEPEDRGIYSGSIGYFSFDGQADQSIVIRTIVWEEDTLSIGVGGALTVMSEPEAEYDETRLKAQALLKAIGINNSADLEIAIE